MHWKENQMSILPAFQLAVIVHKFSKTNSFV